MTFATRDKGDSQNGKPSIRTPRVPSDLPLAENREQGSRIGNINLVKIPSFRLLSFCQPSFPQVIEPVVSIARQGHSISMHTRHHDKLFPQKNIIFQFSRSCLIQGQRGELCIAYLHRFVVVQGVGSADSKSDRNETQLFAKLPRWIGLSHMAWCRHCRAVTVH